MGIINCPRMSELTMKSQTDALKMKTPKGHMAQCELFEGAFSLLERLALFVLLGLRVVGAARLA